MPNKYGQWCPVAKATEILGEKWTILIIRELLMGSTRFSELQRGLGTISPTLLSRRLNLLDEHGLRRGVQGVEDVDGRGIEEPDLGRPCHLLQSPVDGPLATPLLERSEPDEVRQGGQQSGQDGEGQRQPGPDRHAASPHRRPAIW